MTQISPLLSSKFINSRGPPHALSSSVVPSCPSFNTSFAPVLYLTIACALHQPQPSYPGRWLFATSTGPDARISHPFVQRLASYLGLRVALDRFPLQLAASTAIRHFISRLSRVGYSASRLTTATSTIYPLSLSALHKRLPLFPPLKDSTTTNIAPAIEHLSRSGDPQPPPHPTFHHTNKQPH
ncbi:hypothetical protein M3J09_000218 [Ascochyta lentis]